MQLIKSKADSLSLLGSLINYEYHTDIVLEGLGNDFKSVIESIHSRDTLISFVELHEKFINRENLLLTLVPPVQSEPITTHQFRKKQQTSGANKPGQCLLLQQQQQ